MFSSATAHATGSPVLDAQADFRRARRRHAAARVGRWFTGRPPCKRPRTLATATAMMGGPGRREVVALDSIVGTLEPSPQFDERFRPASEVVRHRWERVALAHRRGDALPPVVLYARPDGYYVVDGRHRVSVAAALRLGDIDGWVTGVRRPGERLVSKHPTRLA
jgi:hypothetical protein